MKVAAFDYELPVERIAQEPAADREASRLLVVRPDTREHRTIAELAELIPAGALIVVNDTRVVPARLLGTKADSGGKVEIFLVRKVEERSVTVSEGVERVGEVWSALGRSSKPLRFGTDVLVGPPGDAAPGVSATAARLVIRLLGRTEDGLLEVALFTAPSDTLAAALAAVGRVPLPPYIKRAPTESDAERYQTVFARVDGAVAAPTAGLHLTRALLGRLAIRGCEMATVTLHVGLGTFQPVTVEDLDEHPMHGEMYSVSRTTSDAIARARERGAPVIAVGTTVVRALESAADPDRTGLVSPQSGETHLLIQPGYTFRVVDRLLTNFHLPKSTLLAMVCAFAGTERVLAAYRAAVAAEYRFFSYGDAMLLERDESAGAT
jgi:S-adenosylmethionine:tRNA ribosyltransferase-isomerase